MSTISGGGLSTSSAFSLPDWQSSGASQASGLPDQSTARADLHDFFSGVVSTLTSTFRTTATNQLSGLVNNAADAAAKRLGINLPSSGSSSSKSSTAKTSKTSSSGGQTSAFKNIDGRLAALDGHPAPLATSSNGTTPKFDLNSFLGGLDKITSGNSSNKVPAVPTGKNFSIDSYLATIDQITSRRTPAVNVTA